MADPAMRVIGRVVDMDGLALGVGVDHGSVVVGFRAGMPVRRLTQAQAEEFAHLFVSACWQAGQQAGRMDRETHEELHEEGGCICGRTAAVCAQAGREGGRG